MNACKTTTTLQTSVHKSLYVLIQACFIMFCVIKSVYRFLITHGGTRSRLEWIRINMNELNDSVRESLLNLTVFVFVSVWLFDWMNEWVFDWYECLHRGGVHVEVWLENLQPPVTSSHPQRVKLTHDDRQGTGSAVYLGSITWSAHCVSASEHSAAY